jgi:cytochrome c oxidase cbb3-type subunit IV
MEVGLIRGSGTIVLLLSFVALCVWAWMPAQRSRFAEAERLPFADDDATNGSNP